MTHDTPPKRIWADRDNLTWAEECPGEAMKDCEAPYILASEVAALIAEAEARGRIVGLDEAEKIAAGVAGNVRAFNADRRRGAGEVQAALRAAKGDPT